MKIQIDEKTRAIARQLYEENKELIESDVVNGDKVNRGIAITYKFLAGIDEAENSLNISQSAIDIEVIPNIGYSRI